MSEGAHAALAKAREDFLAFVAEVRPELHRYCARLTGSVIEGEDIVQDALAKAFYAMSLLPEPPPLRPWLFKIAHNAALDFLKSHGRKLTDPHDDMEAVAGFEDAADPFVVRAALACFLALPVTQRSAVILKDVLGHSLEETAETMGTTVMAVKAALVRGRKALKDETAAPPADETRARADLDRYASRFNAKDWDGVRALVADDCRLDLVSRSQRRGKEVRLYFTNYEKANVTVRPARVEGHLALAVVEPGKSAPSYFFLLEWQDGRVVGIKDYRYVPYILADADLVLL
jgi:RNA polymerase sigma-70 factor (ECF subfamily)